MSHIDFWHFRTGGTPTSNQRARDAAAEAKRLAKAPTPSTAYQPPAGVRHRTCQWPMWPHSERPPKPAAFCDAPTAQGCSYCSKHREKARYQGTNHPLLRPSRLWIAHRS
jgi:hypothetical protein